MFKNNHVNWIHSDQKYNFSENQVPLININETLETFLVHVTSQFTLLETKIIFKDCYFYRKCVAYSRVFVKM